MGNKLKYGILFISLSCVLYVIFWDYSLDYPEKFRIKNVEMKLFKVVQVDTSSDCVLLNDEVLSTDTSVVLLLGLRFDLDFVSLQREHIWDDNHKPYGALGHIDSIRNIEFYLDTITNLDVENTFEFKKFQLNKGTLENHSMEGRSPNCYIGNNFESIDKFIFYYNSNSTKDMLPKFNNYFFIKIDKKQRFEVINKKINLKIRFTDNSIIQNQFN